MSIRIRAKQFSAKKEKKIIIIIQKTKKKSNIRNAHSARELI